MLASQFVPPALGRERFALSLGLRWEPPQDQRLLFSGVVWPTCPGVGPHFADTGDGFAALVGLPSTGTAEGREYVLLTEAGTPSSGTSTRSCWRLANRRSCGSEVIARHPRSYERDDFVYDPIHYLPLLERKPGALDQAAPLQGWELPEEFGTLRRLLESRMERRGKREFVQVLRLLETFSQQEVAAAAKDALRLGAISFDAVKHLVLCRLEGRPPRLDLELYPYLPRVRVSTTSAGDYMSLLSGRAA